LGNTVCRCAAGIIVGCLSADMKHLHAPDFAHITEYVRHRGCCAWSAGPNYPQAQWRNGTLRVWQPLL